MVEKQKAFHLHRVREVAEIWFLSRVPPLQLSYAIFKASDTNILK